jgi:rhodanese-related sulfurtransferase
MGLLDRLFGSGAAVAEASVPETYVAMTDPQVQIVDCRTHREWSSGHIAGATLMPLGSIGDRQGELDKGRPIIVVCRSGHRSAVAARQLAASGFVDVRSMKGGINAWHRAGNPLVS